MSHNDIFMSTYHTMLILPLAAFFRRIAKPALASRNRTGANSQARDLLWLQFRRSKRHCCPDATSIGPQRL